MAILPQNIIIRIEETSNFITQELPYELWDDATNLLVLSIKKKAVRKYHLAIAGSKYHADVHAHILNSMKNDRYKVTQRVSV